MKNHADDRSDKAHKLLRENGYNGGEPKHSDLNHEVEKGLHLPGKKMNRMKYASGGSVSGNAPKSRMDKKSRGKKGDTHVNVIVAPPRTGAPPMLPPHPPMAAPPMGAGPRPPVLPPQGAPAAMPPRPPMAGPQPGMMNRGGRVHMKAGAGGGLGRIEKTEEEERQPRKKGDK